MIKSTIPKFLNWLLKNFLLFCFISYVLALLSYYAFFQETVSFWKFHKIFFLGFFISSLFAGFLFFRLFKSLAFMMYKVKKISEGEAQFNTDQGYFFNEEFAEFCEMNKNLHKINNYVNWQKRIISQESSELEAVISALTGSILAIDQDKKILFFNNQAALLFSSQRQLHKKEIFLSEAIRNPDILQAYNHCLKTGRVVKKTLSLDVFDTEEKNSIYEITVAPFKAADSGDFIPGAVGFFYDISNIKKTEQIHLDFITNVSHELRTPLTAIQGYVETLVEEISNNNQVQIQQFLNIIQRNVRRLVSLLNHFLDLSKIDSMSGKKEELDTKTITQSIVKDLHIKNHTIKMEFLQKTVQADPHFLKQVLYNLLDNAIRYVPQKCLIEILWTKEKDFVVLTVKDHGEGIPNRHKNRLFEKFYRVDPSRTQTKGAGVGLSIVKQLIEKQGGAVSIRSEAQEGSSFICYFPD